MCSLCPNVEHASPDTHDFTFSDVFLFRVSLERPMPGQKVRLQTRPRSLLCMTLKSPGLLPGSSPPTSTNQVTFQIKPSLTACLHCILRVMLQAVQPKCVPTLVSKDIF